MAIPARVRSILAAVGCAIVILAVASRTAIVSDEDMAPSLLPGDLVLLAPVTPTRGQVVAVVDPLDPSRWTLRRVEAIGGAITYESGTYETDQKEQLLDMGRDDAGFGVIQEGDHLTRHLARNISFEVEEMGVPDDAAWLGADSRDIAVDSRWWGPVPLDVLQGTVVLRIGAPRNRWRSWVDPSP